MKKVIIIPARLASHRLKNKPLALIDGLSMIERVYRQAQKSTIQNVFVACCDPLIQERVEHAGGTALLTDPDLPSGTDRVYAAAVQAGITDPSAIIINLQGDLPFINPDHISKAADLLENTSDFDITTLAAPLEDPEDQTNPAAVKVAFSPTASDPSTGHAHYFSRAPIPHGAKTFYHHIGIYAFRLNALERFVKSAPTYLENTEKLEQLRALDLGLKIGIQLVDEAPLSVDTPEDLEDARAYAEQNRLS